MISLSYSAATKYLLSPMSWYLHYLLRLRPVDTGSALAFGSALDASLNSLLVDKKNNLPIDGAKAKLEFDSVFKSYNPNNIKYSKADADTTSLPPDFLYESSEYPLAWYCLKYKGHILIDEYIVQVLPKLEKVLEVQKTISLKNEIGDEFTGVIDLIAIINNKIFLIDNKSTSISYKENSASESGQLATYAEAIKDEYNIDGVCYITIPKKLRKQKLPRVDIEFIFGSIPEELIEKTFNDYENVLTGIKNAQFSCTRSQRDGCCSTPWGCQYRSYCESGGTNTEGLKYEEARKK